MCTRIRVKDPQLLELCPLLCFFFLKKLKCNLLLCLWSYFDGTYTTLALKGKEDVVAKLVAKGQ